MSGQQQQQGGQHHRDQDEEQVVDQHSKQDQIPGPPPRPAAAFSVTEGRAGHVDTEEDGAQGGVHAPRQQPEEERGGGQSG